MVFFLCLKINCGVNILLLNYIYSVEVILGGCKMDNEVWKDIVDYEGLYQVSNLGNVKSLGNDKSRREKILSPGKYGNGYLYVILCRNGERKLHSIHRLVLMTFAPCENMENLQVNHLDENKENNNLNNLEWVTCKDNINHGTRNDRVSEKLRGRTLSEEHKRKISKAKSIPIVQLTPEGKYIRSYKSSHEAERECGFNNGAIIQCCNNKYLREGNNIYKDYRWMYLSEFLDKHNGIID